MCVEEMDDVPENLKENLSTDQVLLTGEDSDEEEGELDSNNSNEDGAYRVEMLDFEEVLIDRDCGYRARSRHQDDVDFTASPMRLRRAREPKAPRIPPAHEIERALRRKTGEYAQTYDARSHEPAPTQRLTGNRDRW